MQTSTKPKSKTKWTGSSGSLFDRFKWKYFTNKKSKKLSDSKVSSLPNVYNPTDQKTANTTMLLPKLIIEPSSDDNDEIICGDTVGREKPTTSDTSNPIKGSHQIVNKPRSNSYSNHESRMSSSINSLLTITDYYDDNDQYGKHARERGRSVEIPKPCVHCILLHELLKSSSESVGCNSLFSNYDDEQTNEHVNVFADSSHDEDDEISKETEHDADKNKRMQNLPSNNFLKVPNMYGNNDLENSVVKPRSKSIDVALEFLREETKLDEFIQIIPNKPRAVSIDFNEIHFVNKDKTSTPVTQLRDNRTRLNSSTNKGLSADNITRLDKPIPDWSIDSRNKVHIWIDNYTNDVCYLSDQDCERSGPKKRCVACKIIVHTLCVDKLSFECRATFREAGVRDYRDDNKKENILLHHWVHRKRQDGKCRQCNKSFQNKLRFNMKEIVAIECSWCKAPYHNKSVCFTPSLLTEPCTRGQHCQSIIPPAWIIKMPLKNTFKSSVRRSRSPDLNGSAASKDSHSRPSISNSSIGQSLPPLHTIDDSTGSGISNRTLKDHKKQENEETRQSQDDLELSNNAEDIGKENQTATFNKFKTNKSTLPIPKSFSLHSNIWLNSIPFVVKPIPNTEPSKPLLVYLNPKSGGNQGFRLLKKFQWLLNPRQVFDISDKGPRLGLELFGKVPNLRILVCGGDGTAGWVMSEIDKLNISPSPPIAILPLGTGNDLARTMQWGGAYKDESISKIITLVEEGTITQLDRWNVTSELYYPPQNTTNPTGDNQKYEYSISLTNSGIHQDSTTTNNSSTSPSATHKIPLDVFNNYFSLGVDAAAALEFHECREANPERFNSRLKNKIFYGKFGGKEILKGSWKDLSDYVTIICDNVDYTPRIKELKPHLLLFLNIPKYSAGTTPWGTPSSSEFAPLNFHDGKLEVMGLTTTNLATIQLSGHADRICQCSTVEILTTKTIPVQVDGEPCRLLPSHIKISLRNRFNAVMKPKRRISMTTPSDAENGSSNDLIGYVKISLFVIPLVDYENDKLNEVNIIEAARFYGMIKEREGSTLREVRKTIMDIKSDWGVVDQDFTFLDSTTSERLFRIDRHKEDSHYLMDICDEDLYVLDSKLESALKNESNNNGIVANILAQLEEENNTYNKEKQKTEELRKDKEMKLAFSIDQISEGDELKKDALDESDQPPDHLENDKEDEEDVDDITKRLSEKIVMEMIEKAVDMETAANSTVEEESIEIDKKEEFSREAESIVKDTSENSNTKPKKQSARPVRLRKYKNGAELDNLYLEACMHHSLERLEGYLLDGADILARDSEGRTGLHLATIHKNLAAVHYLINNGPESLLEMKESQKERTALHIAAELNRSSICSLLISAGASLLARDIDNKLPSELAGSTTVALTTDPSNYTTSPAFSASQPTPTTTYTSNTTQVQHQNNPNSSSTTDRMSLMHFLQKEELFERIDKDNRSIKA